MFRVAVLGLPLAIFLIVYSFYLPDEPLINPDSPGYLTFAAYRTGGYPAVLALLRPIVRDVADYAVAQRLLYGLSVLLLACQLLWTLRNTLVSVVAEFALLGNDFVNRYHFAIFTESLFLSTSALFIAAVLAHLRTGTSTSLALASALAGYATAIRPTGLVFIPALVVLVAVAPRLTHSVWRRIMVATVPLIAVLALEAIYYHAHNPGPRQSLLAVQVLGKAGMIDVTDTEELLRRAPPDTKPLQVALETSLAPVRKVVAEAPDGATRCWLVQNYESFVEYRFAPAERDALVASSGQQALVVSGLLRLQFGWRDYLRLSVDHLLCLWGAGLVTGNELAARHAFIESRQPLPFEQELPSVPPAGVDPHAGIRKLLVLIKIGFLAIALLLAFSSAVLLGMLCRRRRPSLELAVGGLCGLIVHGGLLLTAFTGIGIPRYVCGLWVPMAIGFGMSALWLVSFVRPVSRPIFAKPRTTPA